MSQEEVQNDPKLYPETRQVGIHPEGDYAVKGAIILSIMDVLKGNIPIHFADVVSRVETMLASATPITIQEQEPATVVPEALVGEEN